MRNYSVASYDGLRHGFVGHQPRPRRALLPGWGAARSGRDEPIFLSVRFQVESETRASENYAEATGLKGFDPFSGPVAFSLEVARYFVVNNPREFGLEDTYVRHYAPLLAAADGNKVAPSPPIDFVYPDDQRTEEEKALNADMIKKRAWQLETLGHGYRVLGARIKR